MNQPNTAAVMAAPKVWMAAFPMAAFMFLLPAAAQAQQPQQNIKAAEADATKVYTFVEEMPTFRSGGMSELVAYVQQQVRWPQEAGRICVEGRVYASFTVDSTGQVRDARIVKGLQSYFDAEVLRVIGTLTGFIPGRQNGKSVAVTLTVPVLFKIR